MKTNPTIDKLTEILAKLTVDAGEEYHKLHSGKQDFSLTNSRMKYYEDKAEQAIIAWALEIAEDLATDGGHMRSQVIDLEKFRAKLKDEYKNYDLGKHGPINPPIKLTGGTE